MNRTSMPKIRKPCPKQWEELVGTEKRRFCSECQLHVHNFSEMSAQERADFLRTPGRKCGAYLQTPKTDTTSLGVRPFFDRLRIVRPAVAGLAFLTALFTGGCATTTRKDPNCPTPDHKAFSPTEKGEDGLAYKEIIVGEFERPLWQRILWPWGG